MSGRRSPGMNSSRLGGIGLSTRPFGVKALFEPCSGVLLTWTTALDKMHEACGIAWGSEGAHLSPFRHSQDQSYSVSEEHQPGGKQLCRRHCGRVSPLPFRHSQDQSYSVSEEHQPGGKQLSRRHCGRVSPLQDFRGESSFGKVGGKEAFATLIQ